MGHIHRVTAQSRAWRQTASADSHWLVCAVWFIIGNPNLVSVAWEEGKIFETSNVSMTIACKVNSLAARVKCVHGVCAWCVCACVLGGAGV